jgi:hypothetical protein
MGELLIVLVIVLLLFGAKRVPELLKAYGRFTQRRVVARPKPIGWRLTVALSVSSEGVPPGASVRNVWCEPGARWPLEIEVAHPDDYDQVANDHRYVFLRTVVEWDPKALASEALHRRIARMVRKASDLFPFLEYHIRSAFPDYRNGVAALEKDLELAYGFRKLEDIPEELCVAEGAGVGCFSGIPGLYLAGPESYPALGNHAGGFGPLVAALEALAWFSEERRRIGDHRFGRLWGAAGGSS